MPGEIEIIEDADRIKELRSDAKRRQEEFLEKYGRLLFPFDGAWTVETESMLGSEVANLLSHALHNHTMLFNSIHHLQGIHELGLDRGFGYPDFHGNSDVAFYQPTTMPRSIEARIGPQLTYEQDVPETLLPDMGRIALRNDHYFASVNGWWADSRRRHDYESNDTRRHFFFGATVYYVPPVES